MWLDGGVRGVQYMSTQHREGCPHGDTFNIKPLPHSTVIPRHWHGDLKFLRALWDRTKILENIANNFTCSMTWICHGMPTATMVFSRSAHGVPSHSPRVLTGDWLHGHGALMTCSCCAKSCHYASMAYTARMAHPMRFHGVFTECMQAY